MSPAAVERGRWWGEAGRPATIPPRRFHLLAVGLPKTGSTSLAGVFRRYRWGHEFLFEETTRVLTSGDAPATRAFLRVRDDAGGLELDAATFLHRAAEPLVELFPDARFICAEREVEGWAESFLNLLLRNGRRLGDSPWPAWQVSLGEDWIPGFDPGWFRAEGSLRPVLSRILPELYAAHTRRTAHLRAVLPPRRTLWLRTEALTSSVEALAAWAGVEPSTLERTLTHENRGQGKVRLRPEGA